MNNIFLSWQNFIPLLTHHILPIYETHEREFDFMGFHGRRHITRSVIFAELLARNYIASGVSDLDIGGLRWTVAFHDAARQGNGADEWEAESAEACKAFLIQQGNTSAYATSVAQAIIEKNMQADNLLTQILHDADVLEAMRFLVNNKRGLKLFRRNELTLFSKQDLHFNQVMHQQSQRDDLIQEVWRFIFETEWLNTQPATEQFLQYYVSVFTQNEQKYPLMNQMFRIK